MKKVKTPLESELLRSICQYLFDVKHYFGWRQNTGGMFREGRYFAMPKYSMKGIPDIIVVKDGAFIGIECKREKTKQSDHQLAFEELCKKNGARYFVARSVDDVINAGL